MRKKFIYFTIFIFIFLIFKNYDIVLSSTITSVELWLYKVFPYLFIMIIINDILINLNFSSIFKNPSLYVFFMSLLSGTPTSAYIINKLVKNKSISKEYGNITLLFTYFSNPLFLYTILTSIFKSNHIVIKLMIIHYISNFIIFLFYKNKLPKSKIYNDNLKLNISNSIKSSINTTTMVLGTITFYLVVSNIILNSIPFSNILSLLFRGTLELTQGLNYLINMNVPYKELLAIFFISFGGLSIHTQVKCVLAESDLDYNYFLKGRLLQTIIAIILTLFTQAI